MIKNLEQKRKRKTFHLNSSLPRIEQLGRKGARGSTENSVNINSYDLKIHLSPQHAYLLFLLTQFQAFHDKCNKQIDGFFKRKTQKIMSQIPATNIIYIKFFSGQNERENCSMSKVEGICFTFDMKSERIEVNST